MSAWVSYVIWVLLWGASVSNWLATVIGRSQINIWVGVRAITLLRASNTARHKACMLSSPLATPW